MQAVYACLLPNNAGHVHKETGVPISVPHSQARAAILHSKSLPDQMALMLLSPNISSSCYCLPCCPLPAKAATRKNMQVCFSCAPLPFEMVMVVVMMGGGYGDMDGHGMEQSGMGVVGVELALP